MRFFLAFLSLLCLFPAIGRAADQESVYDRVIRTGVLRCGYVVYPPAVIQDPNTKALSGIYPEVVEKMAKLLSLKVEWTEETTWSLLAEGLKNDRYDLFCSAAWPNAARARVIDFSEPLYYSAIDAYTRKGEKRFPKLEDLNKPAVQFSAIEGSTIYFMTEELFPDAAIHSLPENTSHPEMILDVTLKKADAVLAERSVAMEFMKNNPDTIARYPAEHPLMVNPTPFAFKKAEPAFASMINTSISMLSNQGTLDRILDKYEPGAGVFLRRQKPYR